MTTRKEKVEALITGFEKVGMDACYGGTKGHGFWIRHVEEGKSLANDGKKTGNPWFFSFKDAEKLLEHWEFYKPQLYPCQYVSSTGTKGDSYSDGLMVWL